MTVETFTIRLGGGQSFFARIEGELMTVADAFCVLDSGPLPVCVGMCCIDVKMRFDRLEAGAKEVHVTFHDEHGAVAIPRLEAKVDVNTIVELESTIIPLAFFIKQLSVPAFGQYSVDLAVNGRKEAGTTLYVRQKASE